MKRLISSLVFLVLVGLLVVAGAGLYLTRPHHGTVSAPPPGRGLAEVSILTSDGLKLSAWHRPPGAAGGNVLLLHGLGADRRSMAGRVPFLSDAGWGVLLPDLRAHGVSEGERSSMGWREARDAESSLNWLKSRYPGCPVVVISFSLGGVASLLGEAAGEADALVLEAVFADLKTAVRNRMHDRFGLLGEYAAPLIYLQSWWHAGVGPDQISPVRRIARLQRPVMIIAGERDRKARVSEAQALFEAAPMADSLWIVEDAAHQNFHAFARSAYERRLLAFLGRSLPTAPGCLSKH